MKYIHFTVKLREKKYGSSQNHEKDDTKQKEDQEQPDEAKKVELKPILTNNNPGYVFRLFHFENKSRDTVVKIVVGSFLLLLLLLLLSWKRSHVISFYFVFVF